jgi:hypothetical protein
MRRDVVPIPIRQIGEREPAYVVAIAVVAPRRVKGAGAIDQHGLEAGISVHGAGPVAEITSWLFAPLHRRVQGGGTVMKRRRRSHRKRNRQRGASHVKRVFNIEQRQVTARAMKSYCVTQVTPGVVELEQLYPVAVHPRGRVFL